MTLVQDLYEVIKTAGLFILNPVTPEPKTHPKSPHVELQTKLLADIKDMSDNQLMDRAAHYNAQLRRGRRLSEEGHAIVASNIEPFTICQNALQARLRSRLERETDREEKGTP